MKFIVCLLAVVCFCEAKPHKFFEPHPYLIPESYIINGQDAAPGAWPWQLSQTRLGSHSCGCSLLSTTSALSAAHCVDGAAAAALGVIAGLHDRSDPTGSQEVGVASYQMHQAYEASGAGFPNDIAIITFDSAVTLNANVQLLSLPPDNSNNFAGQTCTMTGWGRTGPSNTLPDILQQADIEVITTAQCSSAMSGVSGASIFDTHICLFDSANQVGSCNGDSGGPLNCMLGGSYVVAGVTSWGISSGGSCLQTYPSVYTRTSSYLSWIGSNTP